MTADLAFLVRTATQCRKQFEQGTIPRPLLRDLYLRYQHVADIDSFLSEARELFPHQNCGLASVYLQHVLGQGTIIRGTYHGEMHTFLDVDGLVVDITADQFGGPPVYVGPLQLPWGR